MLSNNFGASCHTLAQKRMALAKRLNEGKVSLAPADLLATVVTPLLATDPARLGRLGIDYPRARL
jgi:hypothetical protein